MLADFAPRRRALRTAVHRRIAAADDHHVAVRAGIQRLVEFREAIRAHQVHAREEFVGRIDSVEVLTRNIQEARQSRAGRRRTLRRSLLPASARRWSRLADHDVGFKLNARAAAASQPRCGRCLWAGGTRECHTPARHPTRAAPRTRVLCGPIWIRSPAQASPAGPLPMMATFLPLAAPALRQSELARSRAPNRRRSARGTRCPTGSPFLPSTHPDSHWSSTGHTRPVIAGSALSSRTFAAAPR